MTDITGSQKENTSDGDSREVMDRTGPSYPETSDSSSSSDAGELNQIRALNELILRCRSLLTAEVSTVTAALPSSIEPNDRSALAEGRQGLDTPDALASIGPTDLPFDENDSSSGEEEWPDPTQASSAPTERTLSSIFSILGGIGALSDTIAWRLTEQQQAPLLSGTVEGRPLTSDEMQKEDGLTWAELSGIPCVKGQCIVPAVNNDGSAQGLATTPTIAVGRLLITAEEINAVTDPNLVLAP